MKINIIVAYSKNYAIGKENKLLWHLADDMAFFKQQTSGKTVVMGKNTFLSLPRKFRPLPNRKNIVISRQESIEEHENLSWYKSLEEAMKDLLDNVSLDEKYFIEKYSKEFYIKAFNSFQI